MKRFVIFTLAVVLAAACGDNHEVPIDAPDQEHDAAPPELDAGADAAPVTTTTCLDRPTDLQRPPSGQLPCELIPPGLTLTPGASP